MAGWERASPHLAGVDGRPLWIELGAALACLGLQKDSTGPVQDKEMRLLTAAKDTSEVVLFALEAGCKPTNLEK